jgi:hypothetical protein
MGTPALARPYSLNNSQRSFTLQIVSAQEPHLNVPLGRSQKGWAILT